MQAELNLAIPATEPNAAELQRRAIARFEAMTLDEIKAIAHEFTRDDTVVRIAPPPTLLQVEQEAFRALKAVHDKVCVDRILRAADAWRAYQRMTREAN